MEDSPRLALAVFLKTHKKFRDDIFAYVTNVIKNSAYKFSEVWVISCMTRLQSEMGVEYRDLNRSINDRILSQKKQLAKRDLEHFLEPFENNWRSAGIDIRAKILVKPGFKTQDVVVAAAEEHLHPGAWIFLDRTLWRCGKVSQSILDRNVCKFLNNSSSNRKQEWVRRLVLGQETNIRCNLVLMRRQGEKPEAFTNGPTDPRAGQTLTGTLTGSRKGSEIASGSRVNAGRSALPSAGLVMVKLNSVTVHKVKETKSNSISSSTSPFATLCGMNFSKDEASSDNGPSCSRFNFREAFSTDKTVRNIEANIRAGTSVRFTESLWTQQL